MTVDKLNVTVFDGADVVADAASSFVEKKINGAINKSGFANIILATGSSQFLFIESLKKKEIDWQKINVFHLDEYKDISANHPASFRKYLKDRILDFVNPKRVFFLNGDAEDCENEMKKYEHNLINHPIDIACIGIGENGHIAFKSNKKNQFDSLVGIVVSQFISTKAADSIFKQIKESFNTDYLSEKHFHNLSIGDIKTLGLSTNKAKTIKELSELFISKSFSDLTTLDGNDLRSNLSNVFGIGPW